VPVANVVKHGNDNLTLTEKKRPAVGWLLLLAFITCCFLAGCAATHSDIPWNAPQPWEGTPGIPGMSGNY
jgi:hypothetical protein